MSPIPSLGNCQGVTVESDMLVKIFQKKRWRKLPRKGGEHGTAQHPHRKGGGIPGRVADGSPFTGQLVLQLMRGGVTQPLELTDAPEQGLQAPGLPGALAALDGGNFLTGRVIA